MAYYILVSNSANACLYSTENLRGGKLEFKSKYTHPESRKKGEELLSDRPGRYEDQVARGSSSVGKQQKSAFEKSNPRQDESEKFAIELAHLLRDAWQKKFFAELVVFSASAFYGLLEKHLDKHIPIKKYISKDYTAVKIEDLENIVHEIFYPEG